MLRCICVWHLMTYINTSLHLYTLYTFTSIYPYLYHEMLMSLHMKREVRKRRAYSPAYRRHYKYLKRDLYIWKMTCMNMQNDLYIYRKYEKRPYSFAYSKHDIYVERDLYLWKESCKRDIYAWYAWKETCKRDIFVWKQTSKRGIYMWKVTC